MNSISSLQSRRLALVIGSGAVKCAAALGMWKVLKREMIKIDMLVGCSGGSLYTSTMALGFDIDDCIEITQHLAHHAEIITVMPDFGREIGLFDTRQFKHVIAQGERAMEEQLPYIQSLLSAETNKSPND